LSKPDQKKKHQTNTSNYHAYQTHEFVFTWTTEQDYKRDGNDPHCRALKNPKQHEFEKVISCVVKASIFSLLVRQTSSVNKQQKITNIINATKRNNKNGVTQLKTTLQSRHCSHLHHTGKQIERQPKSPHCNEDKHNDIASAESLTASKENCSQAHKVCSIGEIGYFVTLMCKPSLLQNKKPTVGVKHKNIH
jgi:hypothetical protein